MIKEITAIVTSQLLHSDSTTTIKVGTSANGTQIADQINIQSSGTSTAVGKGTSSNSAIATGLGAAAPIVFKNVLYRSAETDLHITIAATSLSDGAIKFIVDYYKF